MISFARLECWSDAVPVQSAMVQTLLKVHATARERRQLLDCLHQKEELDTLRVPQASQASSQASSLLRQLTRHIPLTLSTMTHDPVDRWDEAKQGQITAFCASRPAWRLERRAQGGYREFSESPTDPHPRFPCRVLRVELQHGGIAVVAAPSSVSPQAIPFGPRPGCNHCILVCNVVGIMRVNEVELHE